jgi:hypothetical protein
MVTVLETGTAFEVDVNQEVNYLGNANVPCRSFAGTHEPANDTQNTLSHDMNLCW